MGNRLNHVKRISKHPKFFWVFFLGFVFPPVFSQNDAVSKAVLKYEKELKSASDAQSRLKALDSLIVSYADDEFNPKIEVAFEQFKNEFLDQKQTVNYLRLIHNANLLTRYYSSVINQPQKALELSDQAKTWIKKTDSNEVIGNFYLERGSVFYNLMQNDSAISNQRKAQIFFNQLNKKDAYFFSKYFEATSLVDMSQHAKASIILDSCFVFYEQKKDTSKMFDMLNSKSIVFSKLEIYEETKKIRKKLIQFSQNDPLKLVLIHINQGTDESKQGNKIATIDHYKLALFYAEKTDYVDYLKPIILSALSEKLFEYGEIEEGKKYYDEITQNYDTTNESFLKYYKDAKVKYLMAQKDYQNALVVQKEILSKVYDSKVATDIQNAEEDLAVIYEFLGQPEKAIEHYKKYYTVKDSLNNIAKLNSLFYYESLYKSKVKENLINEQNFKISDLSQKNEHQKTAIFGLLILGVLLIMISFTVFKQYQAKKEFNLKAAFSQDLIQMQEQQKTQLAFELHDSIGQRLILLKQKLQASNQEENSNLTAQILEETREISRALYPAILSQVGITEAVKSLIDEIDENSTLFFTHEIENIDGVFSKDQELNIYRFIQESLGNILKHSKASEAFISIKKEVKFVKINIEDNGVGFDLTSKLEFSKSLGIRTMKERISMLKGVLNIKSIQGKFTRIQVTLNT